MVYIPFEVFALQSISEVFSSADVPKVPSFTTLDIVVVLLVLVQPDLRTRDLLTSSDWLETGHVV